jgi:guanylate kinase
MVPKMRIIALFGKSASGKDTLQNAVLKKYPKYYNKIISYTTRPQRPGEVEGFDYYYTSKENFAEMVFENKFIEALEFNGWFYGTPVSTLDVDKVNIGIFTPEGIQCLFEGQKEFNLDILPIYIKCDDKTRMLRILQRENNVDIGEMCRRYFTDEKDFAYDQIDFEHGIIFTDSARFSKRDLVEIINTYAQAFFD